jgi:hypothetical protein
VAERWIGVEPSRPAGFPSEGTLQALLDDAPQLLPLSGAPLVTVIGREVQLGSGYVDILGVEATGRVVLLEVKLARNAEARRAVVAQALAYAAVLNGTTLDAFERIVAKHVRERESESVADLVMAADQEGAVDRSAFTDGLEASLLEGAFRLVFVLDEAPAELVRLVGYLESITDHLVIDLVTVASYAVADSHVIVPQRVDPERQVHETPRARTPLPQPRGELVDGSEAFQEGIKRSPEEERPDLQRLCDWAQSLEAEGLVNLKTYNGVGRQTLLPRRVRTLGSSRSGTTTGFALLLAERL